MNKESGLQSSNEPLSHTCPRCSTPVEQRFYGPCPTCVDQLRTALVGEGGDVIAPEYEPKMNVTPNAVALKDD
ncbi:MAG: hypothetical protein OES24_11285 [Acidimicrobiia bacterium]|nr:hypothetical protein [Acidimicrobiia bacterium]